MINIFDWQQSNHNNKLHHCVWNDSVLSWNICMDFILCKVHDSFLSWKWYVIFIYLYMHGEYIELLGNAHFSIAGMTERLGRDAMLTADNDSPGSMFSAL